MAKANSDPENFCILLAFGKTDEPKRKAISDFKRLPIMQISNVDNSVVNAARLAPSAMNKQSWKIEFSDERIRINAVGRGIVNVLLPKKWSKVDLRIIRKYLKIALENDKQQVRKINISGTERDFSIDMYIE